VIDGCSLGAGCIDGVGVEETLGEELGAPDGAIVGITLGSDVVGITVGSDVGDLLGTTLGCKD